MGGVPMKKLTASAVVLGLICMSGSPSVSAQKGPKSKIEKSESKGKSKAKHLNGKQLVGEKIKTNGNHVVDKKGEITASVVVKDGKIAGLHAKHAQKGELMVKKYKTNMKMALANQPQSIHSSLVAQYYLDTVYIGYAYVDDFGYEEIYWFPYDMILDGDTGAIEYVPADYY
jgi:hypothetical protein